MPAKLIYTAIASLDGLVADAQGGFEWATPDEEVHRFVNDLERPIGTYLYGRRMYDVMQPWESMNRAELPPAAQEYAQIWRTADKVVYSRTLGSPSTPRTRIEREFDAAGVRRLKESARQDISIGGAQLAAQAIAAGLVDELHVIVVPVIVGSAGTSWLVGGRTMRLQLLDQHRFRGGAVHLHYAVA